jgi:hypothetical protein
VSEFVDKLKNCPFVLHAFRVSGNTNLMVLIVSPDLVTVDKMIDACFRSDRNVLTVNVSYIISTMKALILPLNFEIENFDEFGCGKSCIAREGDLNKIKMLIKTTKQKAIPQEVKNNKKDSDDNEETDDSINSESDEN